jgi:hypothetical protein
MILQMVKKYFKSRDYDKDFIRILIRKWRNPIDQN